MLGFGGEYAGCCRDDGGRCKQTGRATVGGDTDVLEDTAKLQEFDVGSEANSKSIQIQVGLGNRLRTQGGKKRDVGTFIAADLSSEFG